MQNRTAPSPYSVGILAALSNSKKHVYGGTVDTVTIAERRTKNKAARKARRVTRRRSK